MFVALILTFLDLWYGRIAPNPQDGIASVYWEGAMDARGVPFDPDGVSCAMRVERLNTVVYVTNQDNGRSIYCPVYDRGPFHQGRVIDLSRGAAKLLKCNGLCNVTIRRKGYE